MKQKKRYNQFKNLPPLDQQEFQALTDLLYEATNGNRSAISRILGIDRRTWDKWITTPPKWPWWKHNLASSYQAYLIGDQRPARLTSTSSRGEHPHSSSKDPEQH